MIVATKTELQIKITTAAPLEKKEWLMKAIVASIRWNSLCQEGDKRENDGDNLLELTDLLEALI